MENLVFNEQEIGKIEAAGEVQSLSDLHMVEDVALKVKGLTKKIDFYKIYKKKKTSTIDEEISGIEKRVNFLKQVILKTLQANNEKSLTFPGTCKITSRKAKGKWNILNEEEFIQFLEEKGELDKIVETVIQNKIVKKEASKLLEIWQTSGELENLANCVSKEADKTSISISYIEEDDSSDEINNEAAVPKKADYDSLDF